MKAFFQQLFDYNFYANKQLMEVHSGAGAVPEGFTSLFSHVLNAHHIWNARIAEEPPRYDAWFEQDPAGWADLHYENQRNSFEILTQATHFDRRISYENSEGRQFSNSLQDILFHMINHGTHHRAQILALLRGAGIQPPVLDYIHYKRAE
ncbi:DinB family protein [Robiginitalea sp. M366]|uniref:DinB family protein n=1 Tax=Robiginitalea aestuariiviva TaxID=3036903 RepID=UPI00240DFABE|nr:DinB family protein [Robiginitalea aestuariiviva]MDG1571326.1 DinB family protein [Robiginitalea aestuariiviva]